MHSRKILVHSYYCWKTAFGADSSLKFHWQMSHDHTRFFIAIDSSRGCCQPFWPHVATTKLWSSILLHYTSLTGAKEWSITGKCIHWRCYCCVQWVYYRSMSWFNNTYLYHDWGVYCHDSPSCAGFRGLVPQQLLPQGLNLFMQLLKLASLGVLVDHRSVANVASLN